MYAVKVTEKNYTRGNITRNNIFLFMYYEIIILQNFYFSSEFIVKNRFLIKPINDKC